MPTIRLWGIANCDTVKRARAELAAQGQSVEFMDFKKLGAPAERLALWEAALGWQRLLNRQGTTWRKLAPEVQAQVVDASSALELMARQPSLIKRPVIEWTDGRTTVGWPQRLTSS